MDLFIAQAEYITWGSQAEKLGIIGILASGFLAYVVAMHRRWIVMGWTYRLEHEEKIMWRTAYMELKGSARDMATVARVAVEKVVQP
jgi:hypothetical protein